VWRRYSEFRALHAALAKEAPVLGRALPPLPGRTVSRHACAAQTVRRRRRQLDCYMRALAVEPRVLACASVRRFLELEL
jgi:hypothetical protein